ncbi:MAG: nucleoside deaminase [Bacteroidetes bacterium]|nr:MAG: nucleoside deaminase [Bacteroidota bacterium]
MIDIYNDQYFMKEALKEAKKAFEKDEVPIGAVIVCNNKIIARSHNMTEELNDSTAHAEMLAITAAENYLGSKYLNKCSLYVTLEPCVMCAGASYWSRLAKVIYGASDDRYGYKKAGDKLFHPKTEIISGIMAEETGELLKSFFKKKR